MQARILVLSPNWLGDAVMALPALGALRTLHPGDCLIVAARKPVAPLFGMVPGVDEVATLPSVRAWSRSDLRAESEALASVRADIAILFTNSFHTAWVTRRAGIPERWGFTGDFRRRLLTRPLPRPRRFLGHHSNYYRSLVEAIGAERGRDNPCISPGAGDIQQAEQLLDRHGAGGQTLLVGMAPGAAYGRAKQWPPGRFAELTLLLHGRYGATTVLVGSGGDKAACQEVVRRARTAEGGRPGAGPAVVDLAGQTNLPILVGVMTRCRAFVSNDSGAMHLAAATGLPVAALFGATNERATAPLQASRSDERAHAILTASAWCRPCMLRECPIDHRCMTRIDAGRVADAIGPWLRS